MIDQNATIQLYLIFKERKKVFCYKFGRKRIIDVSMLNTKG